jgi:hypothetical protein
MDVSLNGALGHSKTPRDLAIRMVRGYEGKDFAFAFRQHIE